MIGRSLNSIVALILLIFLIPLFIVIGIIIKLENSGPIIFKHKRVGFKGKMFTLYKFRSMYNHSPLYGIKPAPNDKQITKIGKFIRKTSLDELPQLINIMKGEMTFIGPRPEMPFIVEEYNNIDKKRLNIKPGITGLWQVMAPTQHPIHKNIKYDLFYLRNKCFKLDVWIIYRTFIVILTGRRSFA